MSDNPVDLVMMKVREMGRYLLAHHVLRDMAENGYAKRVAAQADENVHGQQRLKADWEIARKNGARITFASPVKRPSRREQLAWPKVARIGKQGSGTTGGPS